MRTIDVEYQGWELRFALISLSAETDNGAPNSNLWGGAVTLAFYGPPNINNTLVVEVLELLTRSGFGGWLVYRDDEGAIQPTMTRYALDYADTMDPSGGEMTARVTVSYRTQRKPAQGSLTLHQGVWKDGN